MATKTTPINTEASKGSAVSNPNSTSESGLSTSDTKKLGKMFPETPYLNGLNDTELVDLANQVLHPKFQKGVVGWSNDTHMNFQNVNLLDQTNHGSDEIPKDGYAPFPNPNDKSIQPKTPPGYDSTKPTENLEKPVITSPKVYKTIGETLSSGVKVTNV